MVDKHALLNELYTVMILKALAPTNQSFQICLCLQWGRNTTSMINILCYHHVAVNKNVAKKYPAVEDNKSVMNFVHWHTMPDVLGCSITLNAKNPNEGRPIQRGYAIDSVDKFILCRRKMLTCLKSIKTSFWELYATNTTKLLTVLQKTNVASQIAPMNDRRGKHTPPNKLTDDITKLMNEHIDSYHPSVSHYRCEHAPLRRPELTVWDMYKDFHQKNPSVTT